MLSGAGTMSSSLSILSSSRNTLLDFLVGTKLSPFSCRELGKNRRLHQKNFDFSWTSFSWISFSWFSFSLVLSCQSCQNSHQSSTLSWKRMMKKMIDAVLKIFFSVSLCPDDRPSWHDLLFGWHRQSILFGGWYRLPMNVGGWHRHPVFVGSWNRLPYPFLGGKNSHPLNYNYLT